MKIAQTVRMGAWFLIGANLLMSLGAIWVFMRMAPAIEVIIARNERSLEACEEMLTALATLDIVDSETGQLRQSFAGALEKARGNVTEHAEPKAIDDIGRDYSGAFFGDAAARGRTVGAILRLSRINRDAMIAADKKARQFGNAGAWGVVFMATGVFLFGMLFIRGLKKNVVKPFEEIHAVIAAFRSGDTMRRCSGTEVPKDIAAVYKDINEFLDGSSTRNPKMAADSSNAREKQ